MSKARQLFIMTGEASGDLHGAGVIRALKQKHPDVSVFGVGGKHLQDAGAELIYTVSEINFMGFTEVARHYFFLRRVLSNLKREIKRRKPDAALLIDYPGMNLILAAYLKGLGIPVIWYVAPQVWAWKESRIKKMKRCIDTLCVVFDFEVPFFESRGLKAHFVGHPILEELEEANAFAGKDATLSDDSAEIVIGLLPGSRKQELDRILPVMLKGAELVKQKGYPVKFLLGLAPTIPPEYYTPFLSASSVPVIQTTAYRVMLESRLAWITSGTATLEALAFGTPMIVLYKTAFLNYIIGRRLVKIKNIALANIVTKGLNASSRTVPELLQHNANPESLLRETVSLISTPSKLKDISAELLSAKATLGKDKPSMRVSDIVITYLSKPR